MIELRQEVTGASSSGARAPCPTRPPQSWATITDLTRAVERHEAQLHGMRNWMAAKATYDRNMGEAMCARLDSLILNSGVDLKAIPEVPTYPENLTHPWKPEEPLYDKEEDDDEDDDE